MPAAAPRSLALLLRMGKVALGRGHFSQCCSLLPSARLRTVGHGECRFRGPLLHLPSVTTGGVFVPGARVEEFLYEKLDRKVPSRVTNGELLAQYMTEAANDFGPGTPYGKPAWLSPRNRPPQQGTPTALLVKTSTAEKGLLLSTGANRPPGGGRQAYCAAKHPPASWGTRDRGVPSPNAVLESGRAREEAKTIPIQGSQWNWLQDAETIVLLPWLPKLP